MTFEAGDVASFNDLTPKLGVAYDLFGTGRTALKASYCRYVEQMSYGGRSASRQHRRCAPFRA